MKDKNWIKLNRSIFLNELWEDKEPFDKRSAWIDLLLLANHKDHKIIHDGRIIMAKRGDVNRSMQWLAKRWRWDVKKVLRFLNLLESDEMVIRNSTTHGSTITIVNYDKFQSRGLTDDMTDGVSSAVTSGVTSDRPQPQYKKEEERKRMCKNDLRMTEEAQAKWEAIRMKMRGGAQ